MFLICGVLCFCFGHVGWGIFFVVGALLANIDMS
jgi:hypothetical protein